MCEPASIVCAFSVPNWRIKFKGVLVISNRRILIFTKYLVKQRIENDYALLYVTKILFIKIECIKLGYQLVLVLFQICQFAYLVHLPFLVNFSFDIFKVHVNVVFMYSLTKTTTNRDGINQQLINWHFYFLNSAFWITNHNQYNESDWRTKNAFRIFKFNIWSSLLSQTDPLTVIFIHG